MMTTTLTPLILKRRHNASKLLTAYENLPADSSRRKTTL